MIAARFVPRLRLPLVALLVAATLLSSAGLAVAAAEGDRVVVVVSARNPVTAISRLHLADMYLGRTNRFPNGKSAEPIDQAPASPVRALFYQTYLGRTQAEIKAHWSRIIFTGRGRPPRDVPSDAEVRDLVAGSPHAIGYMQSRLVDATVRVVHVD